MSSYHGVGGDCRITTYAALRDCVTTEEHVVTCACGRLVSDLLLLHTDW